MLPVVAHAQAERQVLENIAANASGQHRYELSLAPCLPDKGCPFEVRLLDDARVVQRLTLDWPASAAPAREAPFAGEHGSGDPMTPGKGPRVWATGEAERTVTVSVQVVRLEDGSRSALLVSQMAGFDHLKRRHAMYAVAAGRLKLAWSYEEPQGPHWSTVTVSDAQPVPALFRSFLPPEPDVPEAPEIRRLAWDAQRQQVRERSAADDVHAVVAGSYQRLGEAYAARQDRLQCLSAYWVLDSRTLRLPAPRRYIVAALTLDPAIAAAEVERVKACEPPGMAATLLRPAKQRP